MTPPHPDGVTYWLLTGDAPTGPFTADQLLAMLAAREITRQARACRVGGSTWRPLGETPGFDSPTPEAPAGPPPGDDHGAARAPAAPADSGAAATPAGSSDPCAAGSGPAGRVLASALGVGVVLLVGYGVYWATRSPSPREVCQRFEAAKTAAEAKKYAARSLHPAIDATFQPSEPGDETEWTGDGPAGAAGGHYVGARVTGFVPAYGRRVSAECVYHLTDDGGWKVADLVLLSFDGQRLDPPLSLARDYRQLVDAAGAVAAPAGPARDADPARAWYETRNGQRGAALVGLAWLKSGGAKVVGVVVLAVIAGAVAWGRKTAPRTRR